MNNPAFLKQADKPLFPQIIWNRPLSRHTSGRLLLAGGHTGGFSLVQTIYQLTQASGIGQCHVILPDSLRPILAGAPDSDFVPSSQSGSLGRAALDHILHAAHDFDAVMLGPDLSHNSETTILLEALLTKLQRPVILFQDSLVVAKHQPNQVFQTDRRLIVATITEIFKLASSSNIALPIHQPDSALNKLAIVDTVMKNSLADWSLIGRELIVGARKQLSLTTTVSEMEFFQPAAAALSAVFWIQQPSKPFEALTTAAYILKQVRAELARPNPDPLTTAEISRAIRTILVANETS